MRIERYHRANKILLIKKKRRHMLDYLPIIRVNPEYRHWINQRSKDLRYRVPL